MWSHSFIYCFSPLLYIKKKRPYKNQQMNRNTNLSYDDVEIKGKAPKKDNNQIKDCEPSFV